MRRLLLSAPFVLFLGIFFGGLNAAYPFLGHDYYYFFPRLLLGKEHFLLQGLSPFRYAAGLCGGFPVYGNPHDVYYSLVQLLSLFLDLWTATQLSTVAAMIVGYIGWVLFGQRVLQLSRDWSHLLALIILSNGYFFVHIMAGHLSFQTLPLMSWFLLLLFEQSDDDTGTRLRKAALFALLVAYVFYVAGYFVILLTAMTVCFVFVFDCLLHPLHVGKRIRVFTERAVLFGTASLAVCLSKLIAVYSVMRFFPRSVPFDQFPDALQGLPFIFTSFFAMPQGNFLFNAAEDPWGIHESSAFLSPLVLLGSLAAFWMFLRSRNTLARQKLVITFAILLTMLFFGELTRGHGLLVNWLQMMPLFSSMHVTERFLYVFAVLLSLAGVMGMMQIATKIPALRQNIFLVPILGIITLLCAVAAYLPVVLHQEIALTLPYNQMQAGIRESHYQTKVIDQVVSAPQSMFADVHHLLLGTTGNDCYEPLTVDSPVLQPLKDGPVESITNGTFNLRNPACLEYPAENHCLPGAQIRADDEANLDAFIHGLPVTWKMSLAQHLADGVTLFSLAVIVLFLIIDSLRTLRIKRGLP